MLKFFCFTWWLSVLMVLTSCGFWGQKSAAKPAYNAQTTYAKLAAQYPFIQIASSRVPSTIKLRKNITYISYGARHLQLDVYSPGSSAHNLGIGLVLVHGGGWASGSRQNLAPLALALAEKGYVAATVSYRLSGEAPYPAAIYDVKAALRWMRKHASTFGIHPRKIVVAGGSAGGQIASLVGVTNGLDKFDPQAKKSPVSSDVQAIVDIDGLIDFTAPAALKYENDPAKKPSAAGAWFGGRYEQKPELWKEASARFYVNGQTPPILFLRSAQPRFCVGYVQMQADMSALGITADAVQIPDTPHSFWLFDPWLQPSVDAIDSFLRKVFKL